MLQQLLILFFIGFGLCLIAYFFRSQKGLKYTLNIVGGLLMAIPFALLIYFLLIIFSH
jgi:predicted membrane protein